MRFDVIIAVRSLVSTPVPVAAAILTIGVAVGLNLAMLGLVDRALLRPTIRCSPLSARTCPHLRQLLPGSACRQVVGVARGPAPAVCASGRERGSADAVLRSVFAAAAAAVHLRRRSRSDLLLRSVMPAATLPAFFSTLAASVAALGLYAAFAHAVNGRRREMAIRLAVGANPGGVVRLVLRESVALATIRVVMACAAAVATVRAVEAMLFDTTPSDPLVLMFAAIVMTSVAALATFPPARAASRNDPSTLLRSE